jgi:hypothetical protein
MVPLSADWLIQNVSRRHVDLKTLTKDLGRLHFITAASVAAVCVLMKQPITINLRLRDKQPVELNRQARAVNAVREAPP